MIQLHCCVLLLFSFIQSSSQESLLSCGGEKIRVTLRGRLLPRNALSVWSDPSQLCNSRVQPRSSIIVFCEKECCAEGESVLNANSSIVILTYDEKAESNMVTLAVLERSSSFNLSLHHQCTVVDDSDTLKSFSKTSVLFVSISFIILMVISLAWLVFYYVQRFRYAHAKDRLQRRLFNAAKKALGRMPARPLRTGEEELEGDCAVCIEGYAVGDVVRSLPCKHIFHKSCIDPWLLEHRTCPMCKADILKAYGYNVGVMGVSEEGGGREEGTGRQRRQDIIQPHVYANALRVRQERRAEVGGAQVVLPDPARPSSHVVNLVHVRARSSSSITRSATFRSSPSQSLPPPSPPSPSPIMPTPSTVPLPSLPPALTIHCLPPPSKPVPLTVTVEVNVHNACNESV